MQTFVYYDCGDSMNLPKVVLIRAASQSEAGKIFSEDYPDVWYLFEMVTSIPDEDSIAVASIGD